MTDRALYKIAELAPGAPLRDRRRKLRRRSRVGWLREKLLKFVEPVQVSLLAVTVVASLLAVGTVHISSLLVIASIALLSFTIACFTEENWKDRVPPPAWVLLGLSLYSLLQSVPLPFAWLRHASPGAAQVWLDARSLLGVAARGPAPLSLDPSASRAEALKWLTYAAVFVTAGQIARRRGAKVGLSIVVLSALAGGLLTIAQGLLGLDKWLGLYEPRYAHPSWALSPLLNSNNFAGYLNLAIFVAIGLAMTGRPPVPRWALGLAAAILFALSLLTGSRGGGLTLLIGMVFVALALRSQAPRARRLGTPTLPGWLSLLGATVAGGTLFLLGANESIWEQLLDETTSKFHIVEWTAPLIRDFLWFGVGRGAYQTVSAAYRTMGGLSTYEHAENFVADWAAEWGVVVSVAAFASFGWLLRPSKLGFLRHPLPTATFIGVFVLFVQNLVDLGLEVTAIGIAVATTLASVSGGASRAQQRREKLDHDRSVLVGNAKPPSTRQRRSRRGSWRPAIVASITALLGTGLILWVAVTSRPDAMEERKELHDTMNGIQWSDPRAVAKIRRALAVALSRHPADAYLPVLGAVVAHNTKNNELPWLGQALRRDPLNARAELLLAESLAARGAHAQALGVLQRCATHEPNLVNVVAERATHYAHNVEELEWAVPEGQSGIAMLNALAIQVNKPEARALHDALLALALKRQLNSPSTHALFVDDLLRDLENPNGPCVGNATARCESQLRAHANVIEKLGPHNLQAVLIHSRVLVHEGKIDEAAEWLSQQCQEFATDTTCATQWVLVASRSKNVDRLGDAANAYLVLACSTPDACASAATWIGNLFMARGNYEWALARYERAANESPSGDAWVKVADAAMRSGHVNRAYSALMSARRLGGTIDPGLEQRTEQARRELLLRGTLH
jgi:tetratricopeptide (TPR) repeat protein